MLITILLKKSQKDFWGGRCAVQLYIACTVIEEYKVESDYEIVRISVFH